MTCNWFRLLIALGFALTLTSCHKSAEEQYVGPRDYDFLSPYSWRLSGTPLRFPESKLVNQLEYGFNRAQFAWFNIDMSLIEIDGLTPKYFTNDDFSNHYVRKIKMIEIYDFERPYYSLFVTNLYYNPAERGAYCFEAFPTEYSSGINSVGLLNNPASRWGGMQCETKGLRDYDSIVIWLMDPFIYDNEIDGDLYINIGAISEDVLKDKCLSFENIQKAKFKCNTVWGRVLTHPDSLDYSYSNFFQDFGYDGMSSDDEKEFYQKYLDDVKSIVGNGDIYDRIANDPSNDDFKHFLDKSYDLSQTGIVERYSYFNGMEYNSPGPNYTHSIPLTSYNTPDNEDLDQNQVLDTSNNYYEYHIKISKNAFKQGQNFIDTIRQPLVKLPNGKEEYVKWFRIKISKNEYESIQGNVNKSIRPSSIRVYLTNFNKPVNLRFGEFNLIKN